MLLGSDAFSHDIKPRWISSGKRMYRTNIYITEDTGAPTTICFVDFRSMFDSVDRSALWNMMLLDGVPRKIVQLIKSYYSSTSARVRVYGKEFKDFDLHAGVRQGCPLSLVLFNFAIDWIMNKALEGYRDVQISADVWISDIEYADDVVN